MAAWWDSLSTALQIFYGIALGATFLMALQLLAMLLGLDGDGDADIDHGDLGADADAGVHIFSVRTIVAFFAGFGWGGVTALRGGFSLPASIAIALLIGGVLMLVVFFLMRALYGMRYSGTLDYQNAVGVVGNVYVTVPAAMQGTGQVEVLVQGRLAVVRAFTRNAAKIPSRAPIRVVGVVDQQTLLVEPFTSGPEAPVSTKEG